MAKRQSRRSVEPKPVDEDDEGLIDGEDDEDDEDESSSGLTCTKRYTVSRYVPQKSFGGSRLYKDFYETDVLADAKKEAEKVVKAEKLEITIWDRDNWYLDAIRYIPESNENDYDSKPKPKHTRKK